MTASADTNELLFPWNDDQFRANPYPWYERARREAPVHQAPDGTFVVTRYDDTMQYARLPSMSIIEPETGDEDPHPWRVFGSTVLWLEAPDHTRMRRLTNRWFTPKLIKQWVQVTRESINGILDELSPGQEVDAHFELGIHPTHVTMCKILDMPIGDVEGMFWALWDAMLINASDPVEGTLEKSRAGLQFMFDQTRERLEEKKRNPGHGLVDELLDGYNKGELTWDEVLGTTVLLYMSGGPNPAYLIGAGFKLFAERPDIMAEFRDNPAARGKIINELARLNPVELIITRFPTEDIEIRGVHIPAGSTVKFPIGAANRDPETFAEPNTFDMHRPVEASRNLTFSLGTHTCAGQLISLAETEAILGAVAKRYTRVELARDPIEVRTDRLVIFDKLPVVLH
ncbi:cytochrome P450 [Rhodococcus fascians]|nr:cytochrome P450 [Rhodococcus fascians]MBY4022445.1 cytochrome P450 [Rhodococcus fascians]